MKLRWLIDESTVGSRDGVLGHTVFPPGARHDAHVHENAEEYIIVVKGKASHLQGEDTFEVKAGEVVYVPRGVVHATRNASKTRNLELFFIYAGAPSLEKTSYRRA